MCQLLYVTQYSPVKPKPADGTAEPGRDGRPAGVPGRERAVGPGFAIGLRSLTVLATIVVRNLAAVALLAVAGAAASAGKR